MGLAALTLILHLSTGQIDDAISSYEAGDLVGCLQALDRADKSRRPTPRTASLRAFCNDELGRKIEAHKAVLAYLAMVANDPPNNDAHRELVEMERRLKKELKSSLVRQLSAIDDEGNEESTRAEQAAEEQAKKQSDAAEEELKVRRKAAAQRDILQDAAELYLSKTKTTGK